MAILDKVTLPLSAWPHFHAIARLFGVSFDTVFSIYSFEVQSRVLRTNHVVKAAMPKHAQRYLTGKQQRAMGHRTGLSPQIAWRPQHCLPPPPLGFCCRHWASAAAKSLLPLAQPTSWATQQCCQLPSAIET